MTSVEVRPFRRADRDQLADLVNAHVATVVPGLAVPVNTLLSRLESEPGEFIVDPWVAERHTLVAEQRGRVVAAAHLVRYAGTAGVGEGHRDAGEVRWPVCWPEAPFWPDAARAGDTLAAAAVAWLTRSGVRRQYADGALPAPGLYGLPEQWPHVRRILRDAGFRPGSRTEDVYLADVAVLPRPAPPLPGLTTRRTLGVNSTRFTGLLDGAEVGHVEVEDRGGDTGRIVQQRGWADVGNLHVAEAHRRRGLATWLLGEAAEWLRLGASTGCSTTAPPRRRPTAPSSSTPASAC
ncbi:GNAT family N-acetyltransferase [Blastococcus sp. SYSU D00669]